MATDNPKVQGYVDPATFAQLMDWKDEQGCKSVSEAVTLILRKFFEGESEGDSPLHEESHQGESLETKIAHLCQRVSHLEEQLVSQSQRIKPKPKTQNQSQGISGSALCKKFGIDSKSVARLARRQGLSTAEYLARETGWKQVDKGWFPPV